jgi:hypothetical protein
MMLDFPHIPASKTGGLIDARLMPTARNLIWCCCLSLSGLTWSQASSVPIPSGWFGIHVVDQATGRGVPLVELRTVNDIRLVTDNAGWIAFKEPGLMNREVFFHVSGPGIEVAKDGFGFACYRPITKEGTAVELKVKRSTVAERLGRLTGQGMYRDSELLGLPQPVPNLLAPGVMGQDSVQAVKYGGNIFWLWGDTNVPHYQLGNYQTTCAVTPAGLHPEKGLLFQYFTDAAKPQKIRHMMPLPGPGAVWCFGLMSFTEAGKEHLLVGYSRQKGLVPPDEQGVAAFDEKDGIFKSVGQIPKDEKWRHPSGCAVRVTDGAADYFYFAMPFAHTRVPATLKDISSAEAYETLRFDATKHQWVWQKSAAPTTQADEMALLREGKMPAEQARYALRDVSTGKAVRIHRASIQWNAWRKRFVLIGNQSGEKEDPSALGEVWYAESEHVDGPWGKAIKVASHPRYTYYNPVHHVFFDADGGRVIYFEGTYSLEFSGNPLAPARYDYNQLMYRLDLSAKAMEAVR